ncbi:metacaspase-3-like [Dorcoceras hygrometricum]|uniref:Metacaspase-3-like n=1 Tax=Dorcoceras hygrometricum TaxID=472368 RepID=A0A2Z7ATA2_9LAMI|nr:metacaspase-3-like [Dorcoceras hygrometricum]
MDRIRRRSNRSTVEVPIPRGTGRSQAPRCQHVLLVEPLRLNSFPDAGEAAQQVRQRQGAGRVARTEADLGDACVCQSPAFPGS